MANLPGARSVAVLDFNADGLLDFIVARDKFRGPNRGHTVLLKNTGNLQFEIANEEAGIPDDLFGLGIAIADLNQDSKLDFFISHSNRLFLSTSTNRFQEATALRKIFQWNAMDDEDWPSGVAFGDLNRDTRMDLVITAHHEPSNNKVFLNQGLVEGIPTFQDVTADVGLAQTIPTKSPHVEIQDFNNDGLPDIYISAAWKEKGDIIPLIYYNQGILRNGLPKFATVRNIAAPMVYFPSGPTTDFNLDGKMDIFLVNWFTNERSYLLANRTTRGNWIQVHAPVGTSIRVQSKGKLIGYQQVTTGYGFASGQMPVCHFGLGDLKSVDLGIKIPGKPEKFMKSVNVNRRVEF
jgi:hypothetical protein